MAGLTIGDFKFLGEHNTNSSTRQIGFGFTNGVDDKAWGESGMFLNMVNSNNMYGWQIRGNLNGSSFRIRALTDGVWGDWHTF